MDGRLNAEERHINAPSTATIDADGVEAAYGASAPSTTEEPFESVMRHMGLLV